MEAAEAMRAVVALASAAGLSPSPEEYRWLAEAYGPARETASRLLTAPAPEVGP